MTGDRSFETVGCRHESVKLHSRVDVAGCAFTVLRCLDCGQVLDREGQT